MPPPRFVHGADPPNSQRRGGRRVGNATRPRLEWGDVRSHGCLRDPHPTSSSAPPPARFPRAVHGRDPLRQQAAVGGRWKTRIPDRTGRLPFSPSGGVASTATAARPRAIGGTARCRTCGSEATDLPRLAIEIQHGLSQLRAPEPHGGPPNERVAVVTVGQPGVHVIVRKERVSPVEFRLMSRGNQVLSSGSLYMGKASS